MPRPIASIRPIAPLHRLEHRLNAYALTAAAAGIGLGMAATSAEAKIIDSPVIRILTSGTTFDLRINHLNQFSFFDGAESQFLSSKILSVTPLKGGAVMVNGGYAQALVAYASIGPNGVFQSQKTRMEFVHWLSDSSQTQAYGPWANVNDRYIGLRFVVNGQTHYGWARFSVLNSGSLTTGAMITAYLDGYAVETVADRPIPAGKSSGPVSSDLERGSLGCLAAGCVGLVDSGVKK